MSCLGTEHDPMPPIFFPCGCSVPRWPQNLGWSLSFQKRNAGLTLDSTF